jgi:hypothetical protein
MKMARMLTVLVVLMLLVVAPVSAQAEAVDPPAVPTLIDALRLIGTTVGAGMVISFLLTRVTWFKNLTGERRFWVVFALCMVIPLAATLALRLIPATVLQDLEPYWQSIAAGFIVFIGSQVQYALTAGRQTGG